MLIRPGATLAVGAALALVVATPAFAAVGTSPAPSSTATGPVLNAVQAGSRLYIGGSFTKVDSAAHAGLAALNASTGVRDAAFKVDVTGTVYSLATDGTTIYLGGAFTSVGGVARSNVAAVTASGQVVSSFHPTVNSNVESIDYANGTVYLGGAFTSVNGTKRPKLAAVDAVSGALVQAFNPKPNGLVHVVKASGSQVYVGGRFTSIGGAARSYVALLDASGAVQPYDAKLAFDSQVYDIDVTSSGVYLGTGGHLPAGNSLYATALGTGTQRWQEKTDGNVQSVEVVGADVYGGGHFNNACLPRSDASTGCLVDFSSRKAVVVADATGAARAFASFNSAFGVWDFTAAGGNLYALGEFTKVNNADQAGIARFPIP